MRDRWLRDAFAVSLPSPTGESEQINHNEHQPVTTTTTTNSIDEEEAVRLLIDYGISEDKAKVRLQVKTYFVEVFFSSYFLPFPLTGNSNDKI